MTTNDPATTDPTTHLTTDERTMNESSTRDTTPTTALPVTPAPRPVTTVASADQPWLPGPAPFAIVLGLLGLLVAGATLLTELTDVTLPWADLGPWTVVAAGLVVVLVGAVGLRSSRRTQA